MALDWLKYQSHKIVRAAEIVEIGDDGTIYVEPHPGQRETFSPTEEAMRKHAKPRNFAMLYSDGFKSICPRSQFLDGYTEVG